MSQSLKGADLQHTVLIEADLTNTDISDANLRHAILQGAKLFNTTLDRSDFRDADLSGINISELGAITCLAWSPDGNYLAVGGEDFNVRIIDCANKKFGSLLRGHRSSIVDIAFIPNSKLLCSVADDLIIWSDGNPLVAPIGDPTFTKFQFNDIIFDIGRPFITLTGPSNSFSLRMRTFKKQSFYSNAPRFSVGLKDSRTIVVRDWCKAGAENLLFYSA